MSLLDTPVVSPTAPIEPGEVSLGSTPTESGALKLVVSDYLRTEQWLTSKKWALAWERSQLLYEPPYERKFWDDTNVPKASCQYYTVAKHVKSIEPQVMNGLFSDDPPFVLNPRPSVSQNTARAISAVLHYQLEDCGFREEIRIGVRDCLTFGTSIWKWGWQSYTETEEVYKRAAQPYELDSGIPGTSPELIHTTESDTIEVEEQEVQIDRPVLENCDLHDVFVDPALRVPDIRKAKFVIHRKMVSAEELEDLRGFEGYDIPSKSDLCFPPEERAPLSALEQQRLPRQFNHQAQNEALESTADPLAEERFELLERWDKNKVIVVLNRKKVIRNDKNSFKRVPFVSVNWWDAPNSFYGIGLGQTVGEEQLIQKGLTEAYLDQTWFNLNLPILVDEESNIPAQNVRTALGKFLKVRGVAGIKPMERIQAVPEAFAEVQQSEARAEATSGANELIVQGNMPEGGGRTSLTRTATGANLLAGGSGARLEAFVERIGDQVFEPVLDAFHEMNRRLLPMETLRKLLSDELMMAYEGDHLDILNAKVTFDVLAAARMQTRRQQAAAMPLLMQTLLTDPMHSMLTQQGVKVDVNELVNMLFDTTGWKNKKDVIVPMSPEDEQRSAMSNPAVQKMLAQKQQQQGQTNSKLQVLDSENSARAFREVLRQVLEKNSESEALNGTPGNQGLQGTM